MGDINEILYLFEKEGGNPRPQNFMQSFRDAIADCNLSDFDFVGDKFMWHRGRIRERLVKGHDLPKVVLMLTTMQLKCSNDVSLAVQEKIFKKDERKRCLLL